MDAQQFLAEFGHIANAQGGVARLRPWTMATRRRTSGSRISASRPASTTGSPRVAKKLAAVWLTST